MTKDSEQLLNITTTSMNIYQYALKLATSDISKFSAQYSLIGQEEIEDYYIRIAKQHLAERGVALDRE